MSAVTYNDAFALMRASQWQAAEQACHQLLQQQPQRPEVWQLLGLIAYQQNQPAAAIERLQRAIQFGLRTSEAYNNLAAAYEAAGQRGNAIASCRHAVELDPHHGDSLRNLAFFLHREGHLADAEAHCRASLKANPKNNIAYNTLGNILQDQNRFTEAAECYRESAKLNPRDVKALGNLGNSLTFQGEFDEALACYDRALQVQPDYPDSHLHRAIIWLLQGDFERGWQEYEWRWRNRQSARRHFPEPAWDGSELPHQTVLLHAEQGLGDTIQFVRYAAFVKRRVARVLLECPRSLMRLVQGVAGVDAVVPQGDPLPPFHAQLPLLSVPRVLETRLESIPSQVPYLTPEPALVERWRPVLESLNGCRIGIAWQGNPGHPKDARRSIPLREFAPVAAVPGVRLISLQRNAGIEQLTELRDGFPVQTLGEQVDAGGAFVDTAAIMQHLDLVISSDTAIAHLAGALGVPVWVALPFVPDWRWLLHRADSPWYPSMRLFRQSRWGDWGQVFTDMAAAAPP